jgi:hypothetical protein
MPSHFEMPPEFLELAEWSSRQGFVRQGCGYLADPEVGEHCLVALGEPSDFRGWSGYLRDPQRLWLVASTGGEGSSVCLWLDDDGHQHIVHHGSGSGSVLFAVLPSALSVLRLFAVGYEEPCWNTHWANPPERESSALEPFRAWAASRWGIAPPPQTGIEALELGDRAPEWLGINGPEDRFGTWLTESGTVI